MCWSSCSEWKWSQMSCCEARVRSPSRFAPAESASSTAYWISGLSTMGSISLGLALVAGRNRLPRPATGNTALVILFCIGLSLLQQFLQTVLIKDRNLEGAGLFELAAGIRAGHHVI